jgi:hypothetical protein
MTLINTIASLKDPVDQGIQAYVYVMYPIWILCAGVALGIWFGYLVAKE